MAIKDLKNKKCFITGAASGIGRATAIAVAREGAVLFLTDINAKMLEEVVDEIRRSGGIVPFSKPADVASFDAVKALAQEIHDAHGSMDVVMNIAGVSTWGTVEELEHKHWKKMIDVNLMGPIHVLETFIPPMIKAGRGGHLVNVSSAAGLLGLPWHAAYSASKFGVRGFSEVLRFELALHDIGVSLVCPGGVNTPLVGTVEILGVDREDRKLKKVVELFKKNAITPEKAASAILRGIKKNQYIVHTSFDIKVGFWFQRKFELPYAIAMRLMNMRFEKLKRASSRSPA
ncbi:MAG TPA: SDR family oxidoreductase [Labilithrix sp.]|nr:SDR family oxidoreductase [Labilithrix sp.]